MKEVQLISISIEELECIINNCVKNQLKELRKQPETEWLTRNDLKRILQVDLSTIHNWTKKGLITPYHLGARVYYKKDEIMKQIKVFKE